MSHLGDLDYDEVWWGLVAENHEIPESHAVCARIRLEELLRCLTTR